MLVTMKSILNLAEARNIAVGAFNITSLEGIQAVLGAAEETRQPVILQFAPVHETIIPPFCNGPHHGYDGRTCSRSRSSTLRSRR